jgi:hypothetical protein
MTEKKMGRYEIGGKTYIQKPLVLGQIAPLFNILKGVSFNSLHPASIVSAVGPKLTEVMAVILLPEGEDAAARDIGAISKTFAYELSLETALEVAEDFLSFNLSSSSLKKFSQLIQAATRAAESARKQAESKMS